MEKINIKNQDFIYDVYNVLENITNKNTLSTVITP